MLLCNQRIEQLTYYQNGNKTLLPIKMGFRPTNYSPPSSSSSSRMNTSSSSSSSSSDDQQKGFWSLLSSKVGSVFQIADEAQDSADKRSLVGRMLNERPNYDGEWIAKIRIIDTKTMNNPPSSQSNSSSPSSFTVYIIEVSTKTMDKSKQVATSEWQVIRRYRQIAALHAKVSSLLTPLPPPSLSHQSYHHHHYHVMIGLLT